MISLKQLTIKNFGSFKQEQIVTFPQSGLLLLHGDNGSGKSSFLKAIAYCLDFLDESASDFINWDNKEDIFVELVLSLNNIDLKIKRGNGFYKLEYGTIKTTGADTSKKIKELICPSQFMSIMTYRGQRQDGNFSKLKPSEKQEFLSELQSLNDFETLIDKTEINIAVLESKLETNKKEHEMLFNSAQYIVDNIDREEKSKEELSNKKIIINTDDLDKQLVDLFEKKKNFKEDTSFDKELESLDKTIQTLSLKLLEQEDEEKNLLKDQNSILKELWSIQAEVNKIDKLQKEIEHLEKLTCPTCKQSWEESDSTLKSSKDKLNELISKKNDLSQLDSENKEILSNLKLLRNQIQEIKNEGTVAIGQFDKLKQQKLLNNSQYQLINKDIDNFTNQKQSLLKQAALESLSLDKQKEQYSKNIELNTKKVEEIYNKLEIIKNSNTSLTNKINEEKEILNVSKDFLRLITEDTLKLISAESSKFAQQLPNAKNFFIKFDTSKLNKNGKIKKEIVLQMFKNGTEIPFKRLSGGEACSVHLATDLAVSKILSSRTGKRLSWFILDESLDGMRINNKIEALNMLKTLSKDKLIIVVDHTSEISEVFDKVLHVIKKDSGSTIQLVQ